MLALRHRPARPRGDTPRHREAHRGSRRPHRARSPRQGCGHYLGIRVHGPARRVPHLGCGLRTHVGDHDGQRSGRHRQGSEARRQTGSGSNVEWSLRRGPQIPLRDGSRRRRVPPGGHRSPPGCGHQLRGCVQAQADTCRDDRVHRPGPGRGRRSRRVSGTRPMRPRRRGSVWRLRKPGPRQTPHAPRRPPPQSGDAG